MIFRWLFGLPMAALVTLGLFGFMAGMIGQETRIDEEKPHPVFDIIAKITPTDPVPTPEARPDPVDPPPPVILASPKPGQPPNPVVPGNIPCLLYTSPSPRDS